VFGFVGVRRWIGTAVLILAAGFSARAPLLSRFGRRQGVAVWVFARDTGGSDGWLGPSPYCRLQRGLNREMPEW
jgi:hypothetical protein